MSFSDSGLGVGVCDQLQCVCDYTTAECMAASTFNHSVSSECSGPRPSCMHRPRPPSQLTDADSSQESSEAIQSDQHGQAKPAGGAKEQMGKDAGKPEAEEDKEEQEEVEDEEI